MSEFVVSTQEGEISFGNQSVVQEVIQNVRMIITTPKGTVPLDREFGIDNGSIDRPLAIAQARMSSDIVAQVKRYEPRARVTKIVYSDSSAAIDGKLKPIVRIEIND